MARLWIRDGQEPKAIAPGSFPAGPGRIVDVPARSRQEALEVLRLAAKTAPEPPEGDLATRRAYAVERAEVEAARSMVVEVLNPWRALAPRKTVRCPACGREV